MIRQIRASEVQPGMKIRQIAPPDSAESWVNDPARWRVVGEVRGAYGQVGLLDENGKRIAGFSHSGSRMFEVEEPEPAATEPERGPGRPEVGRPINWRPGDALLARIDADAAERGATRAEALRALVELALDALDEGIGIDQDNWHHIFQLIERYGDIRAKEGRAERSGQLDEMHDARRDGREVMQSIRDALAHYATHDVLKVALD